MQLMLRPPVPRFHPLLRRGLRGLSAGEINPTTIWTPQTGYLATAGDITTATGPAVYQAPNYVPVPACASGPSMFTPECIATVLAAQQANMAANNAANRAVFLADCNNNWALNDARYAELGMPRPANDCDQRLYGQTLPGTTGSAQQPQIQPIYSGAAPSTAPQFSFTNLTRGDNSNFLVGDRWQILITGLQPNARISVNGGMNGANALTPMGQADGTGRFVLSGQMTSDQVGSWVEAWRANDALIQSLTFTVKPAAATPATGGTGTGTQPGGGPGSFLTTSVQVAGSAVPLWALSLGALALVLFMRGK